MKIYLAIKYHHNLSNKDLIENLSKHFEGQGHAVVNFHQDLEKWRAVEFAPEDLMAEAFRFIDESDLTLVEFSDKSVGFGIEAGYPVSQTPLVFAPDIRSQISGI